MHVRAIMRSPGTNTGSLRTHRPADVGLPGGLIFLSVVVGDESRWELLEAPSGGTRAALWETLAAQFITYRPRISVPSNGASSQYPVPHHRYPYHVDRGRILHQNNASF